MDTNITAFVFWVTASFIRSKEREALNDYMLGGGWGTEFKQTRTFEEMIKEYTGPVSVPTFQQYQ
mgnify:CR=1 FL=1